MHDEDSSEGVDDDEGLKWPMTGYGGEPGAVAGRSR